MKKITILKLLVILLIVLSGCYPFNIMKNEEKEDPTTQPYIEIRPYRPGIIRKPVKIEDIISDYHKKSEQVDEINEKITNFEKRIEETNKSIILESDKIANKARDIAEMLPEPQKEVVKPQVEEILLRSSKIKDCLGPLPEALPETLPSDGIRPVPVDIKPEQKPKTKTINYNLIISLISFALGIFFLWKCMFQKNQSSNGLKTGG